ncbi:type III secretion system chaperone [Kordiimonas sp. SCSIO 12610]|uniref:type III secretion system chaperone n=1 Tax=Kordiimonas sp. SCSIO 12610 TaxID=2829597 RepID=UPI00210CDBA7|nr:type III secretion system chaperone [Kordiimonas sp. SCSIO 12610]UTW53977.1 hypothetical protein KFF44_08995 [Kordiimonas sp. SCSIO 12610]
MLVFFRGLFLVLCISLIVSISAIAQEKAPDEGEESEETKPTQPKMTVDILAKIIMQIDDKAVRNNNSWQFTVAERQIVLVSDPNADRMRVMSPVARADAISPELHKRMLQANFDAVLDARYAIAQDLVWSVFIHPLSKLDQEQLLSGISQVITATLTFGTTFSSGAAVYGGGDTNGIIQKQILDELKEKSKTRV